MINIIKFYEVYCDVEPKRKALAQANAELAFAQDKLGVIKRKVVVSKLTKLSLFLSVTSKCVLESGGATGETNFRF